MINDTPIKILIPTDFSVQAEFAYMIVKRLSEKLPIDVHFLHVLNAPDTVTMTENGTIDTCGEADKGYLETQRDIALRKLATLKELYGDGIQTHLRMGKITDQIVQTASVGNFNLIVTGTKGASGLKEKIAGSETQMIVRKSDIPVLSLMCDRSDLPLENLLLVHDFHHPKDQQLNMMHRIVAAFNSKVHLLQIASKKHDQVEILENMKKFAKVNQIESYEPHILFDHDVESGVIHFNQINEMDMVCIGTHGKGGLFHSSPAEKLVKHMFKPIISFHLK